LHNNYLEELEEIATFLRTLKTPARYSYAKKRRFYKHASTFFKREGYLFKKSLKNIGA
jgi:hypothetical protein